MAGNDPSEVPPTFPIAQGIHAPQQVVYVVQQPGPGQPYNPSAPLIAVPQQQQIMYHQQQPQIVYAQPGQQYVQYGAIPQPQTYAVYNTVKPVAGPYFSSAIVALVLYLVGMLFFTPLLIPSVAISFHLARKRVIAPKRIASVVAFGILEYIAWLFVACFAWFYTEEPYTYSYCSAYYYTGGCSQWSYDTEYQVMWWGWISFVVLYAFALAFGIPRIVFTYQARNNRPAAVADGCCHH
eukprot:TRINITY_DN195_c0_g1_i1.p1 TRINITY_DN195_c0_g1~~TRINITY_DN195_c0_g1_i1.p1  ORF type:complete len:268 (+),score=50.80 TRINITY_DN195_c0_g1_i1:93-806(+)